MDYSGPTGVPDCIVDQFELGVMSQNWLVGDSTANPEAVVTGPVAHYNFENNLLDSSGNGNNGTAEAAATYAGNLKAAAMMSNGAMWPEGSENEFYSGVTRALPEIWTTYPKVAEANQAWKDATNELAAVAGNGLDALRSKIGAVGDSCKGCHDDFRAEDF